MIADHLSRLEEPTKKEIRIEIEENFLDEQLFQMSVQILWYVDIVNYLACATRIQPLAKKKIEGCCKSLYMG